MTSWYFEQATASYAEDRWVAFSFGIHDFDQLRRCKDDALARAESWEERGDA